MRINLLNRSNAVIIFLIFFALNGCGNIKNNIPKNVKTKTPVKITIPIIKDINDYREFNGTTIFLRKEIVKSTLTGFIINVDKNIGDNIEPGDILFQIKTKEYSAADTLSIKINGKSFSGVVNIKSKSKGVLTELAHHAGDFVAEGDQIAVISDPNSLRIKLNLPYAFSNRIKLNTKCKIVLPSGVKLEGKISKIIPAVDSITQTQTYFITLNNHKVLPENLNILVRIALREIRNAVVLPENCLLSNETQNKFWVMKLINDSTAIRVNVKKGIESDSLVQIVSPVFSAKDKIISEGAYGLPDTAQVAIQN